MSAQSHVWLVEIAIGTTTGGDTVWCADYGPFFTKQAARDCIDRCVAAGYTIAHRRSKRSDYRVRKYTRSP